MASKYAIQTECYQHFIKQEADLYYQLPEAASINLLYANLRLLSDIGSNEKLNLYDPRGPIEDFIENTIEFTKKNILKKRFFDKVVGKGTAKKIIDKTASL